MENDDLLGLAQKVSSSISDIRDYRQSLDFALDTLAKEILALGEFTFKDSIKIIHGYHGSRPFIMARFEIKVPSHGDARYTQKIEPADLIFATRFSGRIDVFYSSPSFSQKDKELETNAKLVKGGIKPSDLTADVIRNIFGEFFERVSDWLESI